MRDDWSNLEQLLQAFRRHDRSRNGKISREALTKLFQRLDSTINERQVDLLLKAVGVAEQESIAYEAVLRWLFTSEDASGKKRPHDGSRVEPPDWANLKDQPTGVVLVHGAGDCDQLGLGETRHERAKPTLVKGLSGVSIRSIACGGLHTICVTSEGRLFSWGCGDDGALGRPAGITDSQPGLVSLPVGVAIQIVTCGDSHTCAVDFAQQLWLWGSYKDSDGYIGIVHDDVVVPMTSEPSLVSGVTGVVDVASGANHTLALTGDGKAFSWGSNQAGQLGLDTAVGCAFAEAEIRQSSIDGVDLCRQDSRVVMTDPETTQSLCVVRVRMQSGNEVSASSLEINQIRDCIAAGAVAFAVGTRNVKKEEKHTRLWPQQLPFHNVAAVFCSAECSFLVSREGDVKGCGLNCDGQVGLCYTSTAVLAMTELSGIDGAEWIGGGKYFSAALTRGRVLTWGRAEECGHCFGAGSPAILRPRALTSLPVIRMLRCGMSHTLACSETGEVFTWGCGITHQLGNMPRDWNDAADADAEPSDEQSPYRINASHLHSRFVLAASGGAQHSVELVWDEGRMSASYSEHVAIDDSMEDSVQQRHASGQQSDEKVWALCDEEEERDVVVVNNSFDFWRVQIEAVYRRRNPYKLDKVLEFMEKYKGQEAILYAKVCKKYDLDPSKFYADPAAWEDEDKDVKDGSDDAGEDDATVGQSENAIVNGTDIGSPALFHGPSARNSCFFANSSSTLCRFGEKASSGDAALSLFGEAPDDDGDNDGDDDCPPASSSASALTSGKASRKQPKTVKDTNIFKKTRKRRHEQ